MKAAYATIQVPSNQLDDVLDGGRTLRAEPRMKTRIRELNPLSQVEKDLVVNRMRQTLIR